MTFEQIPPRERPSLIRGSKAINQAFSLRSERSATNIAFLVCFAGEGLAMLACSSRKPLQTKRM
ncbi:MULTISPECIES: hypothetical protein [Bradyrhizobium]|uniref:hypothetical protein n=1 Tax=Bradyrhizobium TaxID=374 RepID=UPI00115FEF5F|nr:MULTISPECIES: hypothetical protein [Bradyrhizobium]